MQGRVGLHLPSILHALVAGQGVCPTPANPWVKAKPRVEGSPVKVNLNLAALGAGS